MKTVVEMIEKLDVKEGDILVIRAKRGTYRYWRDEVRDVVSSLSLPQDVRVLLCEDSVSLSLNPNGVELIMLERQRQIEKGFDAANDALWTNEEMARAAAYYVTPDSDDVYPPLPEPFHPYPANSRIEDLAIAGALIAAEIDRLKAAATP